MLYQKHSPCQTDVQWQEMLGRILCNHLDVWRGTAVIRGTVHPEQKMLVQHDMHLSQASQPILLSPSCQRSTLFQIASRDSTSRDTTIIFRVRVVHTAAFTSLGTVSSCA